MHLKRHDVLIMISIGTPFALWAHFSREDQVWAIFFAALVWGFAFLSLGWRGLSGLTVRDNVNHQKFQFAILWVSNLLGLAIAAVGIDIAIGKAFNGWHGVMAWWPAWVGLGFVFASYFAGHALARSYRAHSQDCEARLAMAQEFMQEIIKQHDLGRLKTPDSAPIDAFRTLLKASTRPQESFDSLSSQPGPRT